MTNLEKAKINLQTFEDFFNRQTLTIEQATALLQVQALLAVAEELMLSRTASKPNPTD